jgi:hypothetical protein
MVEKNRTISLPNNALQRIKIGQAFAEYDEIRSHPDLFVNTPATIAATNTENSNCFFVGRRGSGKTAIAFQIEKKYQRTISILPHIFDLLRLPLEHEEFYDTRQRPFKSLMATMERALLDELIKHWINDKKLTFEKAPEVIRRERNLIEELDFDERVLSLNKEIFDAYSNENDKLWLRQIKRSSQLLDAVNEYSDDTNFTYIILIDRLDESWDGSESAIISLMALMHASVRLTANCESIKPYIFIRENIYDRIRELDNEFSRLETSVVFLEWTEAQLAEFIERRLVKPFNTKPKLGGEAWSYFFENENVKQSIGDVMKLCQHRPRDVLMFCSYALDSAISENHKKIEVSNLEFARKRYSTSRLKDLGDEYAENFPNISLILEFFHGLGVEFTILAIEDFIQKLLTEKSIKRDCKTWFFKNTAPFSFIEIMHSIGFFGLKRNGKINYKKSGSDTNAKPNIDQETTFVIHPTYHVALNLRDIILKDLKDETVLKHEGILEDLPDSFGYDEYKETLETTLEDLKTLPTGRDTASKFEDIVGTVMELCFFRALTNIEPQVRTQDGCSRRDWVAANRASNGFWEMIRTKHGSTQIVWECKNFEDLNASDFYQVQSYLSNTFGHFGVIAFRGKEIKPAYIKQISAVANKNNAGLILPITQNDLEVFLRQAIKGARKESHIQDRYDFIVRKIS